MIPPYRHREETPKGVTKQTCPTPQIASQALAMTASALSHLAMTRLFNSASLRGDRSRRSNL